MDPIPSTVVHTSDVSHPVFGEKELKRKLVQSVSSVKKKIKAFKEGKAELSTALQETFQPITQPLNTLLTQFNTPQLRDTKTESTLQLRDTKTESTPKLEEKKEPKDDDDDEEYEDADDSSLQSELNNRELNPIARVYLTNFIINNKTRKVPYGIYHAPGGQYNVGDSTIDFDKNHLIIKDQKFTYTPGLMELLFQKEPNNNLIEPADIDTYSKIITMTNAHRRQYKPDGQIQGDRSLKYTNYIKQFINPPSSSSSSQSTFTPIKQKPDKKAKTGGSLRKLVTDRSANSPPVTVGNNQTDFLLMKTYLPNTDYVYWDNPNELIDRLRLLIASQNAGNNGHQNEIIAILEELVEANIIETPTHQQLSNILKRTRV